MTKRKNYRMIDRHPLRRDNDGDGVGFARWALDKTRKVDRFLDRLVSAALFEIDLWLRTTHPAVFVFVACSCGLVAALAMGVSVVLCGGVL